MGSLLASYGAMLLIIWVRYLAFSGVVHAYFWGLPADKVAGTQLAKHRPSSSTVWREARTSMAVSIIYAVPAAILMWSWKNGGTALYTEWHGWRDLLWAPVSLLIYAVLHDTYFYWAHRAMHHPRLFEATHRTHHMAKQPTAWAAFSFHPWEAIISAPLVPLLAFIIPMHMGVFLTFLTLMTLTAVANHSGWEIWPKRFLEGPLGRWLITARHHNLHHTHVRRNYGLYFRFWDRLMGTDDMRGCPMGQETRSSARPKGTLAPQVAE